MKSLQNTTVYLPVHSTQRRDPGGMAPVISSRARHILKIITLTIFAFFINSTHVSATSLSESLATYNDLTLFSAALKRSGLNRYFENSTANTIFVPSDTALKNEGMAFLLEKVLQTNGNKSRLLYLLSNHVIPNIRLVPETINGHVELLTLSSQPLTVIRLGSSLNIGPGSIVTRRIKLDKNVIFVVDRLLWPDWRTWPENYEGALMMTHRD